MAVVHAEKLAAVLSDFARTLVTDFPIQGILDHLVGRIVEILPVSAAGVTLISAGRAPRYISASDESAMRFERLQTRLGEGPCLKAYESGVAVAIPDVRTDKRFPVFSPAAATAGLVAVFTFPLRHGEGRLGALDLYSQSAGALSKRDMEAAQTLADVAAAYLANADAREEARNTSDRFKYSAMHDGLTGLPNRVLLEERLEHAAARAHRSRSKAAILFCDLDRFKAVNDTYGHRVGDELLIAVGRRLGGLVRPSDTLVRYSGDEFVFLCEDLDSVEYVEVLAKRMAQAFVAPFTLTSHVLTVTASVGMAFSGPGENISDDLVVRADLAMYQAKLVRGAGARTTVVDLRPEVRPEDTGGLAADLKAALQRGTLDVAYQPVVSATNGNVTGVEALLRWTHPTRGQVPPTIMVEIAEQTGLISEIGAWVLERSCRDRMTWLSAHPGSPLDMAVNVSPRQLMRPHFVSTVAAVLDMTGMDPAALVLEITEGVLLDDDKLAMQTLNALKGLGVRLALDDFGTGFSSLSYLHRLPVDIVKIDQGFIAEIGRLPTGRAIVAAVTNLAHEFGLVVTAEGVETQDQYDEVVAIGCDSLQGFLYGRAVSSRAISRQLAQLSRHELPDQLETGLTAPSAQSARAYEPSRLDSV